MNTRTVLSVLGKDRHGIVAAVATCLANNGANIDDISQTIIGEIFSMTMIVTINEDTCSFDQVQSALNEVAKELGVQVKLQREDVFRFMYEI